MPILDAFLLIVTFPMQLINFLVTSLLNVLLFDIFNLGATAAMM